MNRLGSYNKTLTPSEEYLYKLFCEEGAPLKVLAPQFKVTEAGMKCKMYLIRRKLGYSSSNEMIIDYWKKKKGKDVLQ